MFEANTPIADKFSYLLSKAARLQIVQSAAAAAAQAKTTRSSTPEDGKLAFIASAKANCTINQTDQNELLTHKTLNNTRLASESAVDDFETINLDDEQEAEVTISKQAISDSFFCSLDHCLCCRSCKGVFSVCSTSHCRSQRCGLRILSPRELGTDVWQQQPDAILSRQARDFSRKGRRSKLTPTDAFNTSNYNIVTKDELRCIARGFHLTLSRQRTSLEICLAACKVSIAC